MSLLPLISAFVLSLLLTPAGIVLARWTGLVDMPDGTTLKIHSRPIPTTGGVVLAAAALPAALFSLGAGGSPGRHILLIGVGSLAALALGLADDLMGLRPFGRLLAQAAIGVTVAWGGLRPHMLPSAFLDCALAALIVVSTVNAVNLLDGMDGLASGVAAICCAAFAVLSFVRRDMPAFILTSTIFAAFIGFLPYNFYPASIFLGNSGSSLTGFLLAVLIVLALGDSPTASGCLGAVLIVGLPAADTAWAVLRRLKAGRGIMAGDRDHFYDRLLRRGFSQRQSALIGYTAAASLALSGLIILLAWR